MPPPRIRRIPKALKTAGFLPFEVREILRRKRTTSSGDTIEVDPLSNHLNIGYIKGMIRNRARAYRLAAKSGLTPRDYIDSVIKNIYEDEGYINPDGFPDFWSYFRAIREAAIESGDYNPPQKGKRRNTDKGNIAKQKAKYRERQAQKKYAKERGYISASFDPVTGKLTSGVVFNEKTGKFEVRTEEQ